MAILPDFVKEVLPAEYKYRFSVCTMVTRQEEYLEMLQSFLEAGFTSDVCEYLIVDNSETNKMDAFEAINHFLQNAIGQYVIICHQDIVLIEGSSFNLLNQRIVEITAIDPQWAVLGNAGVKNSLYKRHAIKIAYPGDIFDLQGDLPQKVCFVDENFMLVKNSANLTVSADLKGYHLYGLDLCMVAIALGHTCYAIDFLLIHKSKGKVDDSFYHVLKQVKSKYTKFFKGRYINTTITSFYLSGSPLKNRLFQTRLFRRVVKTSQKIAARWQLAKK